MCTAAGTKQKIQECVLGCETLSAIYDELFDEGGGMVWSKVALIDPEA